MDIRLTRLITFAVATLIFWGGHSVRPRAEEVEFTTEFPKDFKWCVATAGHQVEGNNRHSDWWDFEQKPGNIKDGDKSGNAADHWNRIEQDIALMKSIHVTQYRFSVEWAKIEPLPSKYDRQAIAHYARVVKQLRANGIEPLITLHHFTFPSWVRALGGWEWEGIADAFESFARVVYAEIGRDVQDWVTVNEPLPHIMGGYIVGLVPPAKKGKIPDTIAPFRGLLKAHAAAYHALHQMADHTGKKVRVGMAHHLRTFDPNFILSLDPIVANLTDQIWNWMIPDALETGRFQMNALFVVSHDEIIPRLKGTQDYMGINYYTGDLLSWDLFSGVHKYNRSELEKNDMGWDIYPEGFYRVLEASSKRYPNQTILITENGIADAQDNKRARYIRDHVLQVNRALKNKIKIENYCYWSLLDNFEWDQGFGPRFGLFGVNYKNQERERRSSADYFGELTRTNRLPSEGIFRVPASTYNPADAPPAFDYLHPEKNK